MDQSHASFLDRLSCACAGAYFPSEFLAMRERNGGFSEVITERRKKRYDFPIDFSPICISLNVKFSIPTKNIESFSHFLAFLINHLV